MSESPLFPYPSPEQREAWLERGAERLGGELLPLGASVEGRPLRALRLPALAPAGGEEPPAVLVCANIHGVELIAARVALGLLDALAEARDDEPLAALRRRAEIWVVCSVNPDGYARTWEREGRGKLRELRPNANGVDLNRNFPLPGPQPRWALSLGGWATGSTDPNNAFFKGTHPLSEPETAALERLFVQRSFHAGANLHSCMGRLIPPYVPDKQTYGDYRSLCAAFGAGQPQRRYRRLASRKLNWFTGEQEDHQHHAHRTWAICVEHFPLGASYRQSFRPERIFWRFNPRDPQPWVENDVAGIASYLLAALDRPRPEIVVESASSAALTSSPQ